MIHQFCGRHTVLEGNVQSLGREKLYPNRLKLSLFHRHKLDVSELVMPDEVVRNVRILRTVLPPTNFGEIRLQYIMI